MGNHLPKVTITTPTEGSRLSRTQDVVWTASDADNDALVFTVYLKAPGKTTFTELARLESTEARKYALATTGFADGQYTLRVTATDGAFVALSETTVTFINRGSAVGATSLSAKTATPGATLLLTSEVTKAQAVVEARVYRDGELVQAYPMNDEGRDGDETANDHVYSVRAAVPGAGDYSVEIFTRYQEDGELRQSQMKDAITFSAKMTPGYILKEYAVLLVLITLAAAVAIGVAAWLVLRKR